MQLTEQHLIVNSLRETGYIYVVQTPEDDHNKIHTVQFVSIYKPRYGVTHNDTLCHKLS